MVIGGYYFVLFYVIYMLYILGFMLYFASILYVRSWLALVVSYHVLI